MTNEIDYIEGTYKILKNSAGEKQKYEIEIKGKKFIVFPNVFSPKYFRDTEFFVENLPIIKDEKFLEIGSGIGIISIFAIYNGASFVVAVDINPDAVKNTKANLKKHNLTKQADVFQSDIFSSLKKSEKFNTIFWNIPFGYVEKENLSLVEKSVFDTNYKDTKKFIDDAKKHLEKNGRLLIGFSTTIGRFDLLKKYLEDNDFQYKIIAEITAPEGNPMGPIKVELIEAKLR